MKKLLNFLSNHSMQTHRNFNRSITNVSSAVFYIISEFESLIVRPDGTPFFRRLFLKFNNVKFGRYCFFGGGFRLYKEEAELSIGERACFGENCGIYVHQNIDIGDDFLAAPGLTINNGTHNIETLEPSGSPIKIGNRVWCGVNVTILAGAKIGDDCIIGANSLVRSEIPARSIAVGTPAKVIKTEIRGSNKVWSCYSWNHENETIY